MCELVALDEKKIDYKENYPLSKLCSFGIGGVARLVVFPKSAKELIFAYKLFGGKAIILGNGTNILFVSDVLNVPLIVMRHLNEIMLNDCYVTVGAGALMTMLCWKCANVGLGGLENLAGIPGSVGGMVIMNAGAFGTEICDRLVSVTVIRGGKVIALPKEKIAFGHRYSSLQKTGDIVIDATFKLDRTSKVKLFQTMQTNILWRESHQPKGKSAGSVFKKATEPAGLLIDKAGLKGKQIGGAIISPMHANFIINTGNATAQDVLELIKLAKDIVYEKFGEILEEEIQIIGDTNETNGRFSHTLNI